MVIGEFLFNIFCTNSIVLNGLLPQYEKYRRDYLDALYAEGNERDKEEWEMALAVARIDSIPIKHQLKKGTERVIKVRGGFVFEKQAPTRE